MKTISVSNLKAHLSAELKKVQAGEPIVIVDHRHPVALVVPFEAEPLFVKEAVKPYEYKPLPPLTQKDPLADLLKERNDRW
ncbi:MAG: type II toxin-antitoxin system prevent-host-death family antitoxin [Spirochaetales bacterium]|nr:type II toxin-antitoxin system prevent-host-death family antitoxin [Spirochaetales bacterium]